MLQVTYIQHSGFAVELDHAILAFDFAMGKFPALDRDKPAYLFASHVHGDHFHPVIFDLRKYFKKVTYIISDDVPESKLQMAADEGASGQAPVHRVHPGQVYQIGDCEVHTFASTDEGVAFWVRCGGRTIYHAGDLNDWAWEEDSAGERRGMQMDYIRILHELPKGTIDAAFVPVDPRLGVYYAQGLLEFTETADAGHIFPMHFWEDYTIFDRLEQESKLLPYRDRIHRIRRCGEQFII